MRIGLGFEGGSDGLDVGILVVARVPPEAHLSGKRHFKWLGWQTEA
jgi:hypothetical protein